MSDFKIIETQEQLDHVIGERLTKARAAEREKVVAEYAEKYADYETLKAAAEGSAEQIATLTNSLNEANEKLNSNGQTIDELNTKLANYAADAVKTRIAIENGIPFELANRLQGANEEEIREDAKKFASFAQNNGAGYNPPPAIIEDDPEPNGVIAEFMRLNPGIKI